MAGAASRSGPLRCSKTPRSSAPRTPPAPVEPQPRPWRKSRQKLMPPVKPPVAPGQYDLYPSHEVGGGTIALGIDSLAAAIAASGA